MRVCELVVKCQKSCRELKRCLRRTPSQVHLFITVFPRFLEIIFAAPLLNCARCRVEVPLVPLPPRSASQQTNGRSSGAVLRFPQTRLELLPETPEDADHDASSAAVSSGGQDNRGGTGLAMWLLLIAQRFHSCNQFERK